MFACYPRILYFFLPGFLTILDFAIKHFQIWAVFHDHSKHTFPILRRFFLHPGRLTWNLQMTNLQRKISFRTSVIMFPVNLQGCKMWGDFWDSFWVHSLKLYNIALDLMGLFTKGKVYSLPMSSIFRSEVAVSFREGKFWWRTCCVGHVYLESLYWNLPIRFWPWHIFCQQGLGNEEEVEDED